jgi:hypothetical protein
MRLMQVRISHTGIELIPESNADVAHVEDMLGLGQEGDAARLVRRDLPGKPFMLRTESGIGAVVFTTAERDRQIAYLRKYSEALLGIIIELKPKMSLLTLWRLLEENGHPLRDFKPQPSLSSKDLR